MTVLSVKLCQYLRWWNSFKWNLLIIQHKNRHFKFINTPKSICCVDYQEILAKTNTRNFQPFWTDQLVKIAVFCCVATCFLVDGYTHTHTDVLEQAVATIFVADIRWRLKQHSSPKRRYISSRIHGVVREDSLCSHHLENLRLRKLICDLYVTSSRYSESLLYNGNRGFAGVKQPGRGVDHTSPSSAEVKERVKLYPYSHSETSWPVLRLTLPLALHNQTRTCYVLSILRLRHVIWTVAVWRPRKMLMWRQMK